MNENFAYLTVVHAMKDGRMTADTIEFDCADRSWEETIAEARRRLGDYHRVKVISANLVAWGSAQNPTSAHPSGRVPTNYTFQDFR